MTFLLDTDWVIDHPNGVEAITRKLDEIRSAGLAVSIISVAELHEGVHYSTDRPKSESVLQRFLGSVSVLPVDQEVCKVFGRERGKLRRQGKLVGDLDLLIASTALRHDLTVCTNNRRHFEMVDGLRLLSLV